MNKDEILKALDLDFSKYDYYGNLTVYRHNKETDVSESFWGGKWGKMNVNIAKKAESIFDGGMDIDVLTNSQSDIDYMVELVEESESEEVKMSKKYEYHNNKISQLGDVEFTPKQEKYLEELARKFNKRK